MYCQMILYGKRMVLFSVVGGEETIIRTFPKLSEDVLPADFKEIAGDGELTVIREARQRIMQMYR